MASNKDNNVKYDLTAITKIIETNSNQKARLDTKLGTDYMISNVDVDTLTDIGFVYVGNTNKCGFVTPMFRLGNVEAIYIEHILYVYTIN